MVANTNEFMTFAVSAVKRDSQGTIARAKETSLELDTSASGRTDAFNPVELLLASLSACIVKGVDRVAPTIGFEFSGIEIKLTARRPLDAARIEDIRYSVIFDTNADDDMLALVHKNMMKFGTIFNTVKAGTTLSGSVTRR